MEKPCFSFTKTAAKVPFLLSGDDFLPPIQVPATINQYLRDYQREGIKFLYSHYESGRGAILGDDMGLGKTVQVIGFIAALLHKQGTEVDIERQKPAFIRKLYGTPDLEAVSCKPFLIIGPGSVLYNWLDELETWGYFTASKFHGADKQLCLEKVTRGKLEVVVTTFETFRDNLEDLNTVDWEAVIVDEVHRIKGLQAQTTKALRSVNTLKRYGLTGTALQNNMTELWSILDWAQPDVLGNLFDFEKEYMQVIEKGQRRDSNKRELAEARKKKEEFAKKRSTMMIRRTKKIIADQLPNKDDNIVFCKLTQLQESVYRAVLDHHDMKFIMKMDDPCDCESSRRRSKCCYKVLSDGSPIKSVMFSFMHILLKTANHIALLTFHANSSHQQKKRTREVCKLALKDHPHFLEQTREASFRTLSDPKYCGKMKVLQGLLSLFKKSHSKVLVFSLSTRLLDILEQYIISQGLEYRRIDGSVSNRRRMDIVREFNKIQNIFVCLISTKAGGLGLNLTGANKVVIFDPNWNPSHDLQAQDRAYRIGQRKDVGVYRLISAGTIEENIYLRQIYKQQLDHVAVASENAKRFFHGVQGDSLHKGELFGVKNMFQLQTGDSCLTMDILTRNKQVEENLRGFSMAKYVPVSPDLDEDKVDDLLESEEEQGSADESAEEESEDALGYLLNDESELDLNLHASPQKKPRKSMKNNEELPPPSERIGSFSKVDDIYEDCGVLHVHENKKVVGTSRAENYMTKCALEDVYELHQNSQAPAMEVEPYLEESDEEEAVTPVVSKRGRKSSKLEADHNTPCTIEDKGSRILIGQTPLAIRRRHFEKMVEAAGPDSKSLTDLAEEVLEADTVSRLRMLKDFYLQLYPHLQDSTLLDKHFHDNETSVTKAKEQTAKATKSTKRVNTTTQKASIKSSMKKSRIETSSLTFSSDMSLPLIPNPDGDREEATSSIEVGKARRSRQKPVLARTPRKRTRPSQIPKSAVDTLVFTGSTNLFDSPHEDREKQPGVLKQDSQICVTDAKAREEDAAGNVETLLFDIGREPPMRNTNLSILDDIFSSPSVKRQPAPKKNSKRPETENVSHESSPTSSDIFSSYCINESTLAESSIDCFSEPRKKSKKGKSGTPLKSRKVRLKMSDTDDDGRQSKSGKLRDFESDLDFLDDNNYPLHLDSASLFS